MTGLSASVAIISIVGPVVFYGGDSDGHGAVASERNTIISDARTYDDFELRETTVVEGIWANFVASGAVPKRAYYEIRKGVSAGNGGTLLASGDIDVSVMFTGRIVTNVEELHIRGGIPSIELPPDRYWLTMAPIGFGSGRFLVSETLGTDEGPPSDPNPPVTGRPIHNGNSYFDSPFFGCFFEPMANVIGEDSDFSYGVGVLSTVRRSLSLADSFAVTRGTLAGGGLYELLGSDDRRLAIQQRAPLNIASPNAQVVIETSSLVPDNPQGNTVTVTVETRCTASPPGNVLEQTEVYDFSQQRWLVAVQRLASSADRRTVFSRTGRFVEPGTNRLLVRISWFDRGAFTLNWSGEVDWVLWDIRP